VSEIELVGEPRRQLHNTLRGFDTLPVRFHPACVHPASVHH
jgi:hypothetical protein